MFLQTSAWICPEAAPRKRPSSHLLMSLDQLNGSVDGTLAPSETLGFKSDPKSLRKGRVPPTRKKPGPFGPNDYFQASEVIRFAEKVVSSGRVALLDISPADRTVNITTGIELIFFIKRSQ